MEAMVIADSDLLVDLLRANKIIAGPEVLRSLLRGPMGNHDSSIHP